MTRKQQVDTCALLALASVTNVLNAFGYPAGYRFYLGFAAGLMGFAAAAIGYMRARRLPAT